MTESPRCAPALSETDPSLFLHTGSGGQHTGEVRAGHVVRGPPSFCVGRNLTQSPQLPSSMKTQIRLMSQKKKKKEWLSERSGTES